MTKKKKKKVYQFKITLCGIEPPIWRRIQIRAEKSFWALHVAIQDAMGWRDYHLHQFRCDDPAGGDPLEVGIPDFEDPGCPIFPGWLLKIRDIFHQSGESAVYEYDFGDGWVHDVVLEAIEDAVPRKKYPVCFDGARACPPENCGGSWGYREFVKALSDPSHERHEELREWYGRDFDPETFRCDRIRFDNPDRRLKKMLGDVEWDGQFVDPDVQEDDDADPPPFTLI